MRRKKEGCEINSPIYRQILKEKHKGYSFIACDKTNKIIKIKIWNKYYTSQQLGVDHVKC